MNKKIISFFTSVIIALCNVSVCMAEDSENIVYDTNQQLKKFSSSYATTKISSKINSRLLRVFFLLFFLAIGSPFLTFLHKFHR